MTPARCIKKIIAVTLVLAFLYKDTFAYLDPGTGSFVLQVMIGMMFGAVFALKLFWKRITGFIARIFSRKGKK